MHEPAVSRRVDATEPVSIALDPFETVTEPTAMRRWGPMGKGRR